MAAWAVSSTLSSLASMPGKNTPVSASRIGFTREPLIEWFEAFGGLEQQGWSVAAAAQRERDLAAEQVDLGALEFGQWS